MSPGARASNGRRKGPDNKHRQAEKGAHHTTGDSGGSSYSKGGFNVFDGTGLRVQGEKFHEMG